MDRSGEASAPSRSTGPRAWAATLALLGVIALGLWLRLPGLGDKPLHSDEGVNGWFSLRLFWWNHYRYNPSDYHGPFLYYVNLVAMWILGPTDVSLRIGTALAGGLAPLALLPARRWLGWTGVVVAGALLAVGPCQVYFARTVIHETYLVVFSALWAGAAARYLQAPDRRWAVVAGLAAALCFANKETALLTAACLLAGLGLAVVVGRPDPRGGDRDLLGGRSRRGALAALVADRRAWLLALAAFGVVVLLFFSSFGTWLRGLPAFFEAYGPWLGYGASGRNQGKPWDYFWGVMQHSQGWAVAPAALAGGAALLLRDRAGLALLGWAVAAFGVYSAIPYKTPWCVLQIDLPVFLLIGWGVGRALAWARGGEGSAAARLAVPILVVAVGLSPAPGLLAETREVNADRYDDRELPYVYVQTVRDFYELVQDHLGVGRTAEDPRGPQVLNINAKNPIRWYLITRGWDHDRSRYRKRAPRAEDLDGVDIVVAAGAERAATAALLRAHGDWHQEVYRMRPGWRVTAWYRRAPWEAYQAAGGRASVRWPVPESRSVIVPERSPRR